MPTGYTAIISDRDDLTLREFTLLCARNFVACTMQRDDAMTDPPDPDEKPSDYHREAREKALADLHRYEAMEEAEAVKEQLAELDKLQEQAEESASQSRALRTKYVRMLGLVEGWVPPTPGHQCLKDFMRQQITESTKWDCHDGSYWQREIAKQEIPAQEWLRMKVQAALHSVSYHAEELAKEMERVNTRNQWKRDLINSLQKGNHG